ncbi:MAG: AAA family ATPase [Candidatus Pacebacteria bacterium]|jgi:ABC-type lipoprotein export system ATPase subunit|nr:AAA family ATPase [Candidatus Paceibacterota bacterium]
MPYIKNINVNLFNGKFNQIISFGPNLNILSGVNGTGKTKVLQLLKQGTNVNVEPGVVQFNQMKVIALSPKRNAEKRAQQSLLSFIRTTNLPNKIQESLNKQIRDETYDPYPSFAELFYLKFEKLRSQDFNSKLQRQTLDEFIKQINNEVIILILPNYRLEASWNTTADSLDLKIYKESANDYVSLENLSTGEQELLSLAFNIYLMKEDVDIFLIDEPEIHLNWTIEKNLFDFLEKFSTKYQKQIIVSTHSRIIFYSLFQDYITYLVWEDGQIKVKNKVLQEYKEKIAGESVALLNIIQPKKKTLFVEDNEHEMTVKILLKIYGKSEDSLEIIKLSGGSGIIENFYKIIKQNSDLASSWTNAYFLQDGDNKPIQPKSGFIKLKKYSIESYYMDFKVLSALLNESEENIKNKIIDSIKTNKRKISGEGKNAVFFEQFIDKLNGLDQESLNILDCSQFLDEFINLLGYKKEIFVERYIQKANELKMIEEIFDRDLIEFIKNI